MKNHETESLGLSMTLEELLDFLDGYGMIITDWALIEEGLNSQGYGLFDMIRLVDESED